MKFLFVLLMPAVVYAWAEPDAATVDVRLSRGISWARSVLSGSISELDSLRLLANSLPNHVTATLDQVEIDDDGVRPINVVIRYDWIRLEIHRALDDLPDPTRLKRLVAYAVSARPPVPDDMIAPADETDYTAHATDILSRREFQTETGQNWLGDFLSRMLRKLWDLLKNLFPEPEPIKIREPFDMTGVGQIMMTVLIALGGFLLIFVIVKAVRRHRKKKIDEAAGERHPLLEPGESEEPDEHLVLAQEQAQAGNYRRAVRHVLLSVILHLDKNDLVHYQRHLTNWEYGETIQLTDKWASGKTAAAAWRDLAALFDEVWYGTKPATRSDFDIASECRDRMIADIYLENG